MTKEPGTELYERVAHLETLVDGGPGEAPACKRHAQDVVEIKLKLDQLIGKVQLWSGGLALLMIALNLFGPIIIKSVFKVAP